VGSRTARRVAGPPVVLVLVGIIHGCASPPEAPSRRGFVLEAALRIPGDAPRGELGFRFGAPRDADGDGIADIAAGARFTDIRGNQEGTASVWSTGDGRRLARREGDVEAGLFGQTALIGPDADADGFPDVIASAPNGRIDGTYRGVVSAFSPRSGRVIWRREGEPYLNFGWHAALLGDVDGDGVEDVIAGATATDTPGKAHVLSGRDGSTLHTFVSTGANDLFGWHVSRAADLDLDGKADVLVGAPSAKAPGGGPAVGAVFAFSIADGHVIRSWHGSIPDGEFGQVVCALGDLDGDGTGDVGIGTPCRAPPEAPASLPGEASVFSGRSGERLQHWTGKTAGELYGRIVADAGDIDGDGTRDVAVGAPWHSAPGREKAGRFEVRSGKSGEVIARVEGDRTDGWLGWHIEAGERLGPSRRHGLVVSALRSEEGGVPAAGAIIVYEVLTTAEAGRRAALTAGGR